jgi:hypothetical protein
LPTRLIDISQYDQSGTVKLIDAEVHDTGYAALSHCWGTSKSFTTTTKTLDQRKYEINVSDLPKTFQDAILFTNLLHLQYLWIDSICIIQDDTNDWEEQSAQMSQIYSNSYITIAASRSADDEGGFLGTRHECFPVNVDFSLGNGTVFIAPVCLEFGKTDIGSLNDMPLSSRAWTLQERYLSRRTIHFSQDQAYWECGNHIMPERGLGAERACSVGSLLQGIVDEALTGAMKSPTDPPWIGAWSTLVTAYSKRKLSVAADKLPALAGLARHIAEHTGDRYCAGVWWSGIAYGLCWAGNWMGSEDSSRYEPERFRGPSWSWASIDVPIEMIRIDPDATLCAEFLSCELDIPGKNPYGTVKSGRLTVQAPLVEVHPEQRNVGWPWWDRVPSYPCFALILWASSTSYAAILVRPTNRIDGEYWKVGCTEPYEQNDARILYSNDDIRIITLV